MNKAPVSVIGAGLAGCEAAYQLAERGIRVKLYEQKPLSHSPAHTSDCFCELVCSNSFRSDRLQNCIGLLKEEMRRLGSLVLRAADETRVPAGGALAVDRDAFAARVTEELKKHPNIEVICAQIEEIPDPPAIIATGPLTDGAMLEAIEAFLGAGLHFYDAAAPLVAYESLDMTKIFRASRYGRGDDYLNCPMTRAEYFQFVEALVSAETAPLKSFETPKVFEGCMPVEVMAKRGPMTLAYGPLKPVGIPDPATGKRPFALVQLRQDNAAGTVYNIVGFQTNLKFPEQRRVFSMIPGLEHAEILRYGVMHRNTFLNAPGVLDYNYQVKKAPGIYFAGQITGVEGYIESAASGMLSGIDLARRHRGQPPIDFTAKTAIGALSHYVSAYAGHDFQPANVNFSLMDPLNAPPRQKEERAQSYVERSFALLDEIIKLM